MYLLGALPNVDLNDLEEIHKLEYGDPIRESADFVLVDRLYNVQHCRDIEKIEHKCLSADDMRTLGQLCEAAF